MVTKHTHKNITWVDLESPTNEEVRQVMEEYAFHPSIAEELLLPTMKPKVAFYDNKIIYLILHFPAFKHSHEDKQNQEVDFIIGKDFLITTRYDTIDPLHKFSKVFDANSILSKGTTIEHAGFLFFHMIQKLYRALEHELEYIYDALGEVEKNIFEGKEREMVVDLSNISRDLLNFKQALRLHKEILESLEIVGKKLFGDDFSYQLKAIIVEYYKIQTDIDSNMDSLSEIRATNNSLVSTKQNEVMKILTIMAFITFPLSLVASIFGMNTIYLPIVGHANDFWIITGFMAIATISFFSFFKYKKWL
ncbi:hypothetical protein IIB50_01630 [Patescibacteria group bacterium]|nr:hypothetical protein [Patescibacteria group bacterium]